jgi:cell wall-associated NlpC family hydrolase
VASHRKPKHHPRTFSFLLTDGAPRTARKAGIARTAATLALAGVASATAFDAPADAAPRPTPAQVKERVDALYQEAEVATEKYDGAKERAAAAHQELSRLQDEAARRTEQLNAARSELGTLAAGQYRSGGVHPTVRLLLSSDPQRYLDGAAVLERAGSHQANAIAGYARRLGSVQQVRERAEDTAEQLRSTEVTLARNRATITRKLASAEQLLNELTAEQRQRMRHEDGSDGPGSADRAGRSSSAHTSHSAPAAPNPRAAQAVSFAYAALGKPYVWGATGPAAYDCSGLTQAAWKAGGVSLPRTTYTQISSGPRIDKSRLAPGDLVFFFSGISHVGLYIGDGKMIHAPHPGAPVRIAPINQMPFAGATRPA